MKNENYEHVKAIRDELLEIVTGDYKEVDGDYVKVQEDENGYRYVEADGNLYTEDPDADGDNVYPLDDLEDYTLYEYFNDVLDVEYTVTFNKEYKGVRLMIACGGPNIYVDTRRGTVDLYWWTEEAHIDLDKEVIEAIDDIYSEYFYTC